MRGDEQLGPAAQWPVTGQLPISPDRPDRLLFDYPFDRNRFLVSPLQTTCRSVKAAVAARIAAGAGGCVGDDMVREAR